jgi:uncharacterized membrane protein YhaH (DUF805 family)
LAPKPFVLGLAAVYVAGFASQVLLPGGVNARAGLMPFVFVHAALIWAWTALHIKRLRDAGRAGGPAIGVAAIYSLAVALLLLVIGFVTGMTAENDADRLGDGTPANRGLGLFLVIVVLGVLFSGDLGTFMTIVKLLVLIACLPAIISFAFSIWAGTRPPSARTVPP